MNKDNVLDLQTLYGTERITLSVTSYTDNGNLAIVAETEDGEPWGALTINLGSTLPNDCAYLNVNSNPFVTDFIIRNEIGKDTGKVEKSGFVTYPLFKFNMNRLEELCL